MISVEKNTCTEVSGVQRQSGKSPKDVHDRERSTNNPALRVMGTADQTWTFDSADTSYHHPTIAPTWLGKLIFRHLDQPRAVKL